MTDVNNLFYELIRVAIGNQVCLSRTPKVSEWQELYAMAKKQSLVGICFAGVQKLQSQCQCPPEVLYLQWMGMAAKIQQRNEVLNGKCIELSARLSESKFEHCILKGQSLAPYYGELAALRQPGDIDIWCKGKSIEKLVLYAKGLGVNYEAKHAHVSYEVDGVEVELHPTPSELRCPWHNARLQKWFLRVQEGSFSDVEFNLVFLMVHMYHHVLFEGVGLRQMMDWYFVLRDAQTKGSDGSKVPESQVLLKEFGMTRFARGLMWVVAHVFAVADDKFFLGIEPDENVGQRLLDEIMTGGNFGHYDERHKKREGLIRHGWVNLIKRWRWFGVAPWEIACSPIWSLWQYAWRMRHGYV